MGSFDFSFRQNGLTTFEKREWRLYYCLLLSGDARLNIHVEVYCAQSRQQIQSIYTFRFLTGPFWEPEPRLSALVASCSDFFSPSPS